MQPTGETFTIEYASRFVTVDVYTSGKNKLYKINLPVTFFVAKTMDIDRKEFWTSIPEGNLHMALEIGLIIDRRNLKPVQKSLF